MRRTVRASPLRPMLPSSATIVITTSMWRRCCGTMCSSTGGLQSTTTGKFLSENGLKDLLQRNLSDETPVSAHSPARRRYRNRLYALYGIRRDYYSFVNGQHTTQGGTHQRPSGKPLSRRCANFIRREFDASDVRTSIVAAISVRVQEPVFESQTKNKTRLTHPRAERGADPYLINDFVKTELDNFLHKYLKPRRPSSRRFCKANASEKKLPDQETGQRVMPQGQPCTTGNCDCRVHLNSRTSTDRNPPLHHRR